MTSPATYYGHNSEQLKDGGTCPAKDCVPNAYRTVIDAQTAGMTIVPAPAIRKAADVPCTRGLTQQEAANGVKALTGLVGAPHYDLNRQQVADAIVAFGSIEISLLYRRILNYSWRNSTTFTGGHGTTIAAIRTNPTTGIQEVLWGDPLADGRVMADGKRAHVGFQWVPASVIFAAAEDRGGGVINILVPPDARYASRRTTSSTPLRTSPQATAGAVTTLPLGATVRVRRPVVGGPWTIGTKKASTWWEIDQVGGVAVSKKYPGRTVLYAAAGRLH